MSEIVPLNSPYPKWVGSPPGMGGKVVAFAEEGAWAAKPAYVAAMRVAPARTLRSFLFMSLLPGTTLQSERQIVQPLGVGVLVRVEVVRRALSGLNGPARLKQRERILMVGLKALL